MTKIKEIVDINSGYASAVDVRTEFTDPEKNYARITQYVPIKSHRDAIERIMRAVLPKDKRFYFLTGNYGTGKSHLCLMIANLFSNKSNSSELEKFFANYAKVDEAKSKELKALRKEGRYLVAICDFGNKDDFEEVVLQAIAQACAREEVTYFMDTHFNEALRKIENWQNTDLQARLPKLPPFIQELQEKYPEYTLNRLIEGLKSYREEAMRIFKSTYKAVIGTEFTYEKGNLLEILRDLLSNQEFKSRYVGLLVLFDEFGYTLKDRRVSLQIVQGFAQLCAQGWRQGDKTAAQIVFLATGHRPMKDHSRPDDKADFDVITDRVEEIGLTPEGMEKIIGAIVVPKRTSDTWLTQVAPGSTVFNAFVPECKRIPIFSQLDALAIRDEIFEKIYPMHPMATHCLLKLALEVGSNNRTIFTFFSGEYNPGDQSYPYYAQENDILDCLNNLNLYTTDLLFTYFKENLKSNIKELKETTRKKIMDYEATVRELNKVASSADLENNNNAERILKTMLIFDIIGIKTDFQNIAFALYPKTPMEKNALQTTIAKMHRAKVLYFNGISEAYEFRRSEAVDFDSLIEAYKRDISNYPTNKAQALEEALPFSKEDLYLEAKGYNSAYWEDKRFKRKLASAADLERIESLEGGKVDFFTSLENQLDVLRDWKDSFEGWVVHVLCQTDDDIHKARKSAEKNSSKRILLLIPKTLTEWNDLLLDYGAVESIEESPDYNNYSTQDKARLNDLMGTAIQHLNKAKTDLLEGRNATWYTYQGKVLTDKITNLSDAVDRSLETLYEKRTKVRHQDLNLSHNARYQSNKNIALKDAINRIFSAKCEIEIDADNSQDKGEIRYLKNVFVAQGVLRQIGKPEYHTHKYQIESNPIKFAHILPALADMMSQIQIKQGAKIKVREDIINKYLCSPYGLGPISLSLFLSIVLKNYGDSVRLKRAETEIGDIEVKDFDQIYQLIENNYPNAVLVYRQLSSSEKEFINRLFDLFGSDQPQKIGDRFVGEAYNCMKNWWDNLPTVSKSPIYNSAALDRLPNFLETFGNMSAIVPHDFVFGQLQEIYGYDNDELITEDKSKDILSKIKRDKETIEQAYENIKNQIQKEIKAVFSVEGNTTEDLRIGIQNWFNGLDSNQRDPDALWHSNESKALIRKLGQVLDISDTLYVSIPNDSGFGLSPVRSWTSDRTTDYIQKIKVGKQQIENNKIKVEPPIWEIQAGIKTKVEKTGRGATVSYRQSTKLVVEPPSKGTIVYATSTGEDPRDSKSQRSEIKNKQVLDINGGNKKVRLITADTEGNWSKETEITFIDLEKKHEIRLDQSFGETPIVQFVFPIDEQSFKTSLQSLIKESIDRKIVNSITVRKALQELLRDNEE
jgi:hypothetical protein